MYTYTQSEPMETVATANHFLPKPRLKGCMRSFSFNWIVAGKSKFKSSWVVEWPTFATAWGCSITIDSRSMQLMGVSWKLGKIR